ncbi:MAG: hypothetical protein PHX05_00135 [Acidobacteriota bacterium]|nr:hypothetical protein [Acidobacteriota bacterium]
MKKLTAILMATLLVGWLAGPGWGASVRPITIQERSYAGATHVVTIDHSDLTETNADTAQALTSLAVTSKQRVELVAMELVTAFNAGNNATGSVAVTVGDGAAGADFYLDSTELNSNMTEIWQKYGRAWQGTTTETINYAKTNDPTVTVSYITMDADMLAATNDPAVAVTLNTEAINVADTNDPAVAVTLNTEAINVADTNDPAVAVTLNTETINVADTNDPAFVITLHTAKGYDSTGAAITNAAGEEVEWVTNVLVTATLTAKAVDLPTNATATATLTAKAVDLPTNATATATLTAKAVDLPTNATATATLTPSAENRYLIGATATATVTKGSLTAVTALVDNTYGRKVYTADDTVDFTFTPNSENALSENSAGEVRFYFRIVSINP